MDNNAEFVNNSERAEAAAAAHHHHHHNKRESPITPRHDVPLMFQGAADAAPAADQRKFTGGNSSPTNVIKYNGVHEMRKHAFDITLTIPNFVFMKNWKQAITSDPILIPDATTTNDGTIVTEGPSSWKIIFEPCKRSRHPERTDEEDWIALHVRRDEFGSSPQQQQNRNKTHNKDLPSFVFARFMLTLSGPDGQVIQQRDTAEAVCFGPSENPYASRSSRQWGWERYVRQEFALKAFSAGAGAGTAAAAASSSSSSSPEQHILKVHCDLQVAVPNTSTGQWHAMPSLFSSLLPEPVFFKKLDELRETGQLCDAVLISGDNVRIPVHRCVLSAISEPLAKMFGMFGFKEASEKEIRLPTMPGSMLRRLVNYAYSGENVNVIIPAAPVSSGDAAAAADVKMVHEVLKVADQYGVMRLKVACENRLCLEIISNNNNYCSNNNSELQELFLKELDFADTYNCESYRTWLSQYAAQSPSLASAVISYQSHRRPTMTTATECAYSACDVSTDNGDCAADVGHSGSLFVNNDIQ